MRIETHNARAMDPESSHRASEAITKSSKRQRHINLLVDFVTKHPGMTSAEIAVALQHPDIDRHESARRLADAKGLLLKQGPARRCTACKGMALCVTWYPADREGVSNVA